MDKQLIEDVDGGPDPGHVGALRLRRGPHVRLVGALQPFAGKVYQTTLDPEAESQIKAALEQQAADATGARDRVAGRLGAASDLADVLVPDLGVARDERLHERLALGRVEVHDLHARASAGVLAAEERRGSRR